MEQRILISVGPEQLHFLMCQAVDEGGYAGARTVTGGVRFLLWTLRTYWPNWLQVMTANDMNMCACECCQIMTNLHVAYVAKRRNII